MNITESGNLAPGTIVRFVNGSPLIWAKQGRAFPSLGPLLESAYDLDLDRDGWSLSCQAAKLRQIQESEIVYLNPELRSLVLARDDLYVVQATVECRGLTIDSEGGGRDHHEADVVLAIRVLAIRSVSEDR